MLLVLFYFFNTEMLLFWIHRTAKIIILLAIIENCAVSTHVWRWGWPWCSWWATSWSPLGTGTCPRPRPARSPPSAWRARQRSGRKHAHPACARQTSAWPGQDSCRESRSWKTSIVSTLAQELTKSFSPPPRPSKEEFQYSRQSKTIEVVSWATILDPMAE